MQNYAASEHISEQEPSGPGHAHMTQHTERDTDEQEPSGPGHCTRNATQHNERAHRLTGAKLPRTAHTQHNVAGEHTGKQEGGQVAQNTAHTTQHTERAHR